jgi:hypothetical protein
MVEQSSSAPGFAQRVLSQAKSAKSRRWGFGFLAFLVLFGLFGFFAGPPLLKSILLKQLSAELKRDVSIASIDINPYAMSARIAGVKVVSPEGKELAGFDELFVNVSGASLFRAGVVVDEIRLTGPRVAVARLGEGQYDISDLLEKWLKPSEPSPTPRFSLNNIQVINGRVEFDDQPVSKQHVVSEINFSLPFLSSLPYQADIFVEPNFSARFGDSPIALAGRSRPFSARHESELNLDLTQFHLAPFQAYLPPSLPFRLRAATVDADLTLVFSQMPDGVSSLTLKGASKLTDVRIDDTSDQSLLAWKELSLALDNVDLIKQEFAIGKVALDGLDVRVEVNRQGELNWLSMANAMSGPAPADAPANAKAVTWSVAETNISNGLMRWRDASNLKPVAGEVRKMSMQIGRVDSKMIDPIEIPEFTYEVDLGERYRLKEAVMKGLKLDLHQHQIEVAEFIINDQRAIVTMTKEGKLDWISVPVIKVVRTAKEELSDDRPWNAVLGKLAVNNLSLRLEDQRTSPTAVQVIDNFNLTAEGLSTAANAKGQVKLATRINSKGSLKIDGSVQLKPLVTKLQMETQAIPLLPLQPYFTEFLNIALTRGQISSKGELMAESGAKGLAAGYKGSLTLGDLLAVDKLNNADFLRWKSLYFGAIDFKLQPMSVNIGEIALADFYSRLIVSPEGRLNLLDIVKKEEAPAGAEARLQQRQQRRALRRRLRMRQRCGNADAHHHWQGNLAGWSYQFL